MARGRKTGGRKAAPKRNGKVTPTLSPDAIRCLRFLIGKNGYGSSISEVAAYLIRREIDDLTRAGVLPKSEE